MPLGRLPEHLACETDRCRAACRDSLANLLRGIQDRRRWRRSRGDTQGCASLPERTRPVRIRSVAMALPASWISRCVPPCPAMRPTPVSGSENRASSAATIMSQVSASSKPPPTAWPRTAATIGLRARAMRSNSVSQSASTASVAVSLSTSRRSAPTEKKRSVPARTITLTLSSFSASRTAPWRASISSTESGFPRLGTPVI